MRAIRLLCLVCCLAAANTAHAVEPTKLDLFQADTAGYQTYRIPGVVVTKRGTVLVYCEARKSAKSDWGTIDVMLRRSTDGGATFDAPRRIVEPPKETGVTVNNPLAIADAVSGAVHMVYCFDYARCFYIRSVDDGVTFSKPVEITSAFEQLRPRFDWKVIATGPGHGLRLKSGRLLVPVWLAVQHSHRPSCVATIYSDDDGKTWHAGDIVATHTKETPNPSETVAAELSDGRVLLNIRNESPSHHRLIATSKDGSTGWTKTVFDENVFDPICMASLARAGDALVFANPAGDGKSKARRELTLRLSHDDGKTWPDKRLLEPGIAAYSDLATLPDGKVLCLYECGGVNDQQFYTRTLRLAKFDPSWITAGDGK